MGIYRKKPVEIEAVRFDGHDWEDEDSFRPMFEGSFDVVPDWLTDAMAKKDGDVGSLFTVRSSAELEPVAADAEFQQPQREAKPAVVALQIVTLEGTLTVSPGDWIIRGTAGELYPCKPEIFADIYEPVLVGRSELSE